MDNFGFPAPPTPASLANSFSSSVSAQSSGCLPPGVAKPNCGNTKRWDEGSCSCVDSGLNGSQPDSPTVPTPGGGGNGDTPDACAGKGMVWRPDTKQCEFPDARSKAGHDTCTGAMPNCPSGQDVWCDFDDMQFKCAQSTFSNDQLCARQNRIRRDQGKPELPCDQLGFGPSGGGGGGNSGNSGKANTGNSGASSGFNSDLGLKVNDLLNAPSRYTPEALQALYGQITSQASGAITRGQRDVSAQAAARGMSRAGSTQSLLKGVRDTVEQQRGTADTNVLIQKINADHQDKLDALDRAQKYLDSMRDNEYRYTLVGEQARQFNANLTLAYANLANQRAMLASQLQSQWDMLQAQEGFFLVNQGT